MDWVNGHDIEALTKWAMKKGEHLTAFLLFVMELTCLQNSPRPSLQHQSRNNPLKRTFRITFTR